MSYEIKLTYLLSCIIFLQESITSNALLIFVCNLLRCCQGIPWFKAATESLGYLWLTQSSLFSCCPAGSREAQNYATNSQNMAVKLTVCSFVYHFIAKIFREQIDQWLLCVIH